MGWGGGGCLSYSDICGYSYAGVGGRTVTLGLSRDVRVTLTQGWGVERLSVDNLGMSELL